MLPCTVRVVMLTAVTGASGHLGANLVRALLADGHDVRVLAHSGRASSLADVDVTSFPGDVEQPKTLEPLLDGVDVCYHLAAKIALTPRFDDEVLRTNTLGPRNVAAACIRAKVGRMVHFSSIHALSPHPLDQVVTEKNRPNSGNHLPAYDRSKAAGEREVLAAVDRGLDAVILNPTGVIGPYDFAPRLTNRALLQLHHRLLPSMVQGGFNWVDSRDVAAGAIAAAQRGRVGERYLLSGHWMSLHDTALLVAEVTGSKPVRLVTPQLVARGVAPLVEGLSRLARTAPVFTRQSLRAVREHRHISHEKATDELGYAPRPIIDTMRDTFEFFQEQGFLEPGWRPAKSV
jgi:dihydroflavonol-4-reductase